MSLLHQLRAKWASLFRSRADRELDEELRFHLAAQIEENIRRGMTCKEAERAARVQLGGEQQVRESCREVRPFARLEWLAQDLRFGLRLLAKEKSFTAVAVLTLALGIGTNLAAFNVLNSAMFRPLPIRNPDSLVRITRQSLTSYSSSVSYPAIEFLARNNSVLSSLIVVKSSQDQVDENLQQKARVKFVTANYFSELGVGAAYGRVFDPATEGAASQPVAVVSYAYWQRNLGSETSAIGKSIRVNLKPATIIGVAPYDFTGLTTNANDLWLLLPQHPFFVTGSAVLSDPQGTTDLYARLKPGISIQAARDGLKPASEELRKLYPGAIQEGQELVPSAAGYTGSNQGRIRNEELALAAALVALFLLILVTACVNLGNLLLARAVSREREISIRAWIGASRGRIIFQFLAESFLLALFGTVAGFGFAYAGLRLLEGFTAMPPQFKLHVDFRVLLFALGVALVACFLSGLAPALEAARRSHRRHWMRRFLIGVQVATSCVLLIVSALLVRSLNRALNGHHGFEYSNVMALDPQLENQKLEEAKVAAYFENLRARFAPLPGVEQVSLTTIPPFGNRVSITFFAAAPAVPVYISDVDAEYFKTMAIPILRGRNFRPGEKDVVIVSESLAKALWPGQDPLGQRTPAEETVIGIAGSARTMALRDGSATELYRPVAPRNMSVAVLLVKTAGPPEPLAAQAREIALAVDSNIVPSISLVKNSFRHRIQESQSMALVITSLGVMAAILSGAGVFGLVAYAVSQKHKEIGIRMALGAASRNVLRMVLGQFARPLAAGLASGMLMAAGVSVALRSNLYGLSNYDPWSYAAAVVLFLLIAGSAAIVPARRALRVDPIEVLRHD